MNPNHQACHK